MLKIYFLKGAPASGKSTWSKQRVDSDPFSFVRINNDDIRTMINNYNYSKEYEKNFITKTRQFLIKQALKNNKNIIIDNVNVNKHNLDEVYDLSYLSSKDIEIIEVPFFAELNELYNRNSNRINSVPEYIILQYYKEFGGDNFKNYQPQTFTIKVNKSNLIQDKSLPKAIIIDLDGTVADCSHRSPYSTELSGLDKPIQYVVDLVRHYYNNDYRIIFCTGRDNKFNQLTHRWIVSNVSINNFDLFMRPSGSKEPDWLVKENIYINNIKDKYYIAAVVDDRLNVCKLWYKLGLPLFRVGDPDSD